MKLSSAVFRKQNKKPYFKKIYKILYSHTYTSMYKYGNKEENLIMSSNYCLFCNYAKMIKQLISFHRLLVSMKLCLNMYSYLEEKLKYCQSKYFTEIR